MKPKAGFEMLKETFRNWSEDKAARLAAALAYYTIFSIAPLLIIAVAVAGLVYGREAVQGQLMTQISGTVGQDAAALIQSMIQKTSKPSTGILATVIGVVMLLLGASGLFGQLQDALNTIWEVTPRPGQGIVDKLRTRLTSFLMVLGIGALLLASLVVSTVLSAAGQVVGSAVGQQVLIGQILNFVISFLVLTLAFALLYKVLPDVEISWKDVWVGAAVTSLLFSIGRVLLGLYLGRASVASPYGAAGSLVVLLLWIYYSAQILFLGAEFTQVYARRYGTRIQPAPNAIPITAEARAQQGMAGGNKAGMGAAAHDRPLVAGGALTAARKRPVAPPMPARFRSPATVFGGVLLGMAAAFASELGSDKRRTRPRRNNERKK